MSEKKTVEQVVEEIVRDWVLNDAEADLQPTRAECGKLQSRIAKAIRAQRQDAAIPFVEMLSGFEWSRFNENTQEFHCPKCGNAESTGHINHPSRYDCSLAALLNRAEKGEA